MTNTCKLIFVACHCYVLFYTITHGRIIANILFLTLPIPLRFSCKHCSAFVKQPDNSYTACSTRFCRKKVKSKRVRHGEYVAWGEKTHQFLRKRLPRKFHGKNINDIKYMNEYQILS